MYKVYSTLLMAVFTASTYVFAVDISTETTSVTTVTYENIEQKKIKKKSFFGDFGFQTNAIVQDIGEVPGNQHFGSMNLNYKTIDQVKDSELVLSFNSRVNNENVFQYSVSNAYLEYQYSTSRLALGRAKLNWSPTDEVWGLGKINNRINFDYFEPGNEGLVGVFYDRKFNNCLLYTSPSPRD